MTSILVVDDDELFARSLARDLKRGGFDTAIALTAEQAWKELESAHHDVVLTDLRMQPHSGLELIHAIHKAHPGTGPVLMSGYATARDYQQAVRAGCAAFLVKPFSNEELLEAVEQALTLRTGFRGSVHGLTLTDMLQMFHLSRRTLEIQVRGKTFGCIRLRDGEVIDASSDDGNLEGMVALRHLLSREQGVINTVPLPADAEQTLAQPFDFLLMDAIRENDEVGKPTGVHSARPPEIDWGSPPAAIGNTALAPQISVAPPAASSISEPARRRASSLAPLEQSVQVVSGWLGAMVQGVSLPPGYRVAAVCCSEPSARVLKGADLEGDPAQGVVELVEHAQAIVEGPRGFVELVREGLAMVIGWDREADAAVLMSSAVEGTAEVAKFRGHASVLRRAVTKDL